MDKKNIIIISSIILLLGIGTTAYLMMNKEQVGNSVEVDENLPNMERLNKETGEYTYSSEEAKKLSEEANVNLEIGNVEVEEKVYFEKEEKEYINSNIDPVYRGEIIKNTDNNQEWVIKAMIPMEGEIEYKLWKVNNESTNPEQSYQEIGKLENTGYEEYEIKVTGQELKGNYIIAKSSDERAIYSIEK